MDIKKQLLQSYQHIRAKTEELCQPLFIEDYVIQGHEDVSPPKWHLAHTTWFFETFILISQLNYQPFDPVFQYLFNSYYQSLGNPYPRMQRGILSRPTVETIYLYRKYVDEHVQEYIHLCTDEKLSELISIVTVGLHHEQQHQELLVMDVKFNFSLDPSCPIYKSRDNKKIIAPHSLQFNEMEGGVIEIGGRDHEFCFDNELPRHQFYLKPYLFANRLITNGEYIEFINAGGYQNPNYWLSDGWDTIQKNQWQAPLYWKMSENKWYVFTLNGLQEINLNEPVAHVSYYEADAYARWKNKRLPTESEWENVVTQNNITAENGNFMEENYFHPIAATSSVNHHQQLFGDLWEWTASAYLPYPGYKPLVGALGEYNGKFMNNQFVLRGGCCVTPKTHIRPSYRNFFQPDKRWQFSGIRLADNA